MSYASDMAFVMALVAVALILNSLLMSRQLLMDLGYYPRQVCFMPWKHQTLACYCLGLAAVFLLGRPDSLRWSVAFVAVWRVLMFLVERVTQPRGRRASAEAAECFRGPLFEESQSLAKNVGVGEVHCYVSDDACDAWSAADLPCVFVPARKVEDLSSDNTGMLLIRQSARFRSHVRFVPFLIPLVCGTVAIFAITRLGSAMRPILYLISTLATLGAVVLWNRVTDDSQTF